VPGVLGLCPVVPGCSYIAPSLVAREIEVIIARLTERSERSVDERLTERSERVERSATRDDARSERSERRENERKLKYNFTR
jgi:hypothetical protein